MTAAHQHITAQLESIALESDARAWHFESEHDESGKTIAIRIMNRDAIAARIISDGSNADYDFANTVCWMFMDKGAGYVDAFYEICQILEIPALDMSPQQAFETVIKPKLRAICNVFDDLLRENRSLRALCDERMWETQSLLADRDRLREALEGCLQLWDELYSKWDVDDGERQVFESARAILAKVRP